jgi:hypothetical protein
MTREQMIEYQDLNITKTKFAELIGVQPQDISRFLRTGIIEANEDGSINVTESTTYIMHLKNKLLEKNGIEYY